MVDVSLRGEEPFFIVRLELRSIRLRGTFSRRGWSVLFPEGGLAGVPKEVLRWLPKLELASYRGRVPQVYDFLHSGILLRGRWLTRVITLRLSESDPVANCPTSPRELSSSRISSL